jgi:uncharacterized protein
VIEIKLFGSVNLNGYTFIEGFPGIGLVGPMAISYIIDKLGMKYIGYMQSDHFPPLVSIHKGEPVPPIRLYTADKEKLVTIFAEFPIPIELVDEISTAIYDFLRKSGIVNTYSIGGIPDTGETVQKPFVVASNSSITANAVSSGLQAIEEGVATGVSALLLMKAALDKGNDICIMVPVHQNIADPAYAEIAITSLNKLMNLNIDITDLDKEAKIVQAKIKEIISKHKESHESYKKAVDDTSGPSMYA